MKESIHMVRIKKILSIMMLSLLLVLTGCVLSIESVTITNGETLTIKVGESATLTATKTTGIVDSIKWSALGECVSVDSNGKVTGLVEGVASVIASASYYSDVIEITVVSENANNPNDNLGNEDIVTINLIASADTIMVGDRLRLDAIVTPENKKSEVVYTIVSGSGFASIENDTLTGVSKGEVQVQAKIGDVLSNIITIKIDEILTDPYENMTKEEFYSNYTEATSYMDAYYRSLHGFMSGSIEDQAAEPTIAENRPMENGMYLKNSYRYYSSDGNTYLILDAEGDVVNTIYKGGAYVTLEEVAAYLFAFGDIPANYTSNKKGSPSTSIWGEYLRLNNTKFSGSTSKYPYEPELPNISGCGGDLDYFEIDLGTTGTDTGNGYAVSKYNDGNKITRGAARLVYSRYDKNGDNIIDINEKFVFYTYNHYNDFQEYLNYENGWGEMFGNITGGGTLSSKNDYNPTPYVDIILKDFSKFSKNINVDEDNEEYPCPVFYVTIRKELELESV